MKAALAMALLAWSFGCGASDDETNPDTTPGLADEGGVGPTSATPPGPAAKPVKGAGFTCEVKKLLTTKCQTWLSAASPRITARS